MNLRNLNHLAAAISAKEGKSRNLPISEIKEVLRCLGDVLRELSPEEALAVTIKIIKGKGR